MFCEKCENELHDEDRFCEKCGNQVRKHAPLERDMDKNKKRNNIIIIGIILVVIAVIAAVILVNGVDKKDTASTNISIESTNTETKETTVPTEVTEPEVITVGTVEQLYESDEYVGKRIEITGDVNYEDASSGVLKMYGSYSEVVVFLEGASGYELPLNDCLTVTGIVQQDQYGSLVIYVEDAQAHGGAL